LLSSHSENFYPLSLNGRDIFDFRDVNRCLIVQRYVRAQEVVMGDDESSESDSAVVRFEAVCLTGVEFEGSVEPFNKLFKWPKESRFFVDILKANNLAMFNAREFFRALRV